MNLRSSTWYYFLFFLVMATVPIAIAPGYLVQVLSWVCIHCLMAASMRFIMLSGHVNFAQGGFVGIGAYTSALLTMRTGLTFWFAIPAAGCVSGIVALAFGLPTLKLRGAYFFMASFAFAEIIRIIFHYFFTNLFGGVDGIIGIPWPKSIFGISFDPNAGWNYYYIVLLASSLSLLILYRLEHKTRLGPILKAIGQSEGLAESVGINAMAYKVMSFFVGCFFAGIAGSLYAHLVRVIAPYDFSFMLAVHILIYIVVGGRGFFSGPIIAATLFTLISSLWLKQLQFWETVAFAATMLATILFLPDGMLTLPKRIMVIFKAPTRSRLLRAYNAENE